ncbi:MAG: LD-carboxypeptidase [Burkholderiales bacterium]|nr:LD-carboxypeptidase [Burkholderiales bacterium]
MKRRELLGSAATLSALSLPATGVAQAATRPPLLRAQRLKPGDTLGLISPSNATFEREPLQLAVEALQALGFRVKLGRHVRGRWGHFGGTDTQRAEDVNAMFADPEVQGIIALTGGSGGTRILPLIDYAQIRRTPKFFGGFSDLTALVNAIRQQTGLITFHSPVAGSEWNAFSVEHFRRLVMQAEMPLLANPSGELADNLVQRPWRSWPLRPGKARGRLIGGNLAVLTAMAGSPYWPQFDGALLFLEDINEYIYRVDRMFSTLRLTGALSKVAGVVLGQFTKCEPGEGFGALTLDEVFDDYLLPLNVPVYRGAMIGHIKRKFTVPVGALAEMDAEAGTIRLLEASVQ